jgi:cation diffusion facilitator CzcD-associated flavoprotein CzcO
VGGGFSGLGVGIELLKRGITDFVILEKASQLGGTWRENTYPGCACDVPSHLYSFSYAPNPDWSRVFSPQPEIQAYLLRVAQEFGVMAHVQLDTEVEEARWSDDAQRWFVRTNREAFEAEILVAGAGPLHLPKIPKLPGLESFGGTYFHTAQWNHEHDLKGRRVAVVGTGSSSIQLVPEIQPLVKELLLFQRTAAWVLPKPDHAIPALEKALFRYVPAAQRAYRSTIYHALELVQLAQRRPKAMERLQFLGTGHLARAVKDPALRAKLTPDFVLGCKRFLLSNTYYPALTQPNAQVIAQGVREVTPTGLVSADGTHHEVDTIVFGTGFEVSDPPISRCVVGRDGRTLGEVWGGSPEAYLGTTVSGFPNLFLMLGPNVGNGHSSALGIIEAQAKYLASGLEQMARQDIASLDLRPEVQARFNDDVQEALRDTVWNAGGCASWYLDDNGVNSAIYPWTTIDLFRRLRRLELSHYEVTARAGATKAAARPATRARVGV